MLLTPKMVKANEGDTDLFEDANNDMKVSMISEHNEEEGSTTLTGYQDITVEMKWKVINE